MVVRALRVAARVIVVAAAWKLQVKEAVAASSGLNDYGPVTKWLDGVKNLSLDELADCPSRFGNLDRKLALALTEKARIKGGTTWSAR